MDCLFSVFYLSKVQKHSSIHLNEDCNLQHDRQTGYLFIYSLFCGAVNSPGYAASDGNDDE